MPASNAPQRQLTLLDTTCIIVGIIIGAGIYSTSPSIAASVDGPVTLIAVWIAGGVAALLGALCYAELATTYPHEGGDYVFLTKAYGRPLGLLFAWSQFWVIRPANIAAMAYIFALYAQQLIPVDVGRYTLAINMSVAIAALTAINVLGVESGKWTQNILTVVKVAGLAAILVIAFAGSAETSAAETPRAASSPSLYLAMILVLFTYGGWNEVVYVAAEVENPEKNILRSLVLGTCLVTLIYVAVNLAFLAALGFEGLAQSDAVASDVLAQTFGPWSGRAISALICISCLGAINGMIFTSARIYYATGAEHRLFRWLGHWNRRRGTPVRALLLQSAATLALVVAFGQRKDALNELVALAAPLVWFFFLLVGIGLFRLRAIDSGARRGYRVHAYPWTPLLFCAANLFLLYASLAFLWEQQRGWTSPERLWLLVVVASGLLIAAKR